MLFQRNTNSVELTHAGKTFMDKARKIIDMVEQLQKEMNDISQMRKGKLIVGSLPITGSHILPLVLPVFQQKFPDIEITLVEETTTNLEQLAKDGQTDVCLLTLPLQEPSLTYEKLIEEEILLAVPPDHPLARQTANRGKRMARIAELRDEPFIILKNGQGFREITLELCQKADFFPKVVFESSNIETVQSLVAAGMGVAFVPLMVTRAKWSHFVPVYLPLENRPQRTLVIAYRKGRYLSKAASAFIATLKDALQSRQPPLHSA
jgi:DNA-binding transcriptional LysR family regulator